MKLVVRYPIHDSPSPEKDAQIEGVVGLSHLQSKEIEVNKRGMFRVLRFLMPRDEAYFEATLLEQEVAGISVDVEPTLVYHGSRQI